MRLHHHASGSQLRSAQAWAGTTGQVGPRHRTPIPRDAVFHVNRDRLRPVAQALADAFLSSPEWTPTVLLDRGRRVLGADPPWLPAVAVAAATGWTSPPRDSPRELAMVLRSVTGFGEGRPVRVVDRLPAATRMGPARWPVAPLHDITDVADLLRTDPGHLAWYADPRAWQRREPAGHLQLYRRRWLTRPGRTPRLLEVPTPRLRTAQRVLLDRVLAPIPVHDAAHGFVAGRSAVTGAAEHVGADVVLTLDLAAFFATVTSRRVFSILRTAGYPEPVAAVLTGLCTSRATRDDLATMPPGGSPAARAVLRAALAGPHLPQGAPSSPQLANLAAQRLDRRLAGYAHAAGATYTRYADDLTFSGGPAVAARIDSLRGGIESIVRAEGFALQPAKTRVRGRGRRQTVTGIVVNERTSLPRAELDALRARLTNAVRRGPSAADLAAFHGDPDALRAHLTGRVAWVAQVHPGRGARLAALLADVPWSSAGPPAA